MAGRNHHLPPHNVMKLREGILLSRAAHPTLIEDPHHLHRVSASSSVRTHPEDRIALNHREIQTLVGDNQRLGATHVALKQELAHAQLELRELTSAAARVKAERDNQVRQVYERSLKLDAELRSFNAMAADLTQVRMDIKKLSATREELNEELKKIDSDIVKTRSELLKLPAIKADIDMMRQEVQKGRTAIEYEQKTRASNNAHRHAMEKNMATINREIEKLRSELENAEKKEMAMAAAAAAKANPNPAYAANYGNPIMGYGRNPYPDMYNAHQVPDSAQAVPPHGAGLGSHGPNDMQQPHVHR